MPLRLRGTRPSSARARPPPLARPKPPTAAEGVCHDPCRQSSPASSTRRASDSSPERKRKAEDLAARACGHRRGGARRRLANRPPRPPHVPTHTHPSRPHPPKTTPTTVRAPAAAKKQQSLALSATAALLATPVSPAFAANADTDAAVDSAIATAVDAVRAAGGAVKTGAEVLAAGFKALQQGYEVAAPVVKQAADLAAPALREARDLAAPVVAQAAPAVSGALSSAVKATGVDVNALGGVARDAADLATAGAAAATPALGKVAAFLADKDPLTLGEYGLGATAAAYLAPALGGALAGGLRGYAGDLTPVQALDALANEGGAVLVDVRSSRDKESQGLPEVASSASGRVLEVEFATTDDRKLRSSLRDPAGIELKVTALQIAGLKRVSKGARVIVLDRSGGQAKAVARELARLGFGKAFVVQGGFDSWIRSKLLVKPAAPAFSPAASLPASIARTISTRPATPATRKALPAGR